MVNGVSALAALPGFADRGDLRDPFSKGMWSDRQAEGCRVTRSPERGGTTMQGSLYLITPEVATCLLCSVRTVRELTGERLIPNRRLPSCRKCLFRVDELEACECGAALKQARRWSRPASSTTGRSPVMSCNVRMSRTQGMHHPLAGAARDHDHPEPGDGTRRVPADAYDPKAPRDWVTHQDTSKPR